MQDRKRIPWRDLDGIVLMDKPAGLSSNQALQRVRRLFGARKAGHAGSLDPFATGMLPICFGKATRVNAFLLDSSKRYRVMARLGSSSSTGDTEGEITDQADVPEIGEAELLSVMKTFTGEIEQIPPMFSALKHEGKRLYQLAREGVEVERPPRQVVIHDISLIAIEETRLSFEVHCSKGTYIRTLVEDLARELGTLAYTQALHRLWVSPFENCPMQTLEKFEAALDPGESRIAESRVADLLMPIDAGLEHLDRIDLDQQQMLDLCHGRRVSVRHGQPAGLYRLYGPDSRFLAVATACEGSGISHRKLMLDSTEIVTGGDSGT